MSYQNAKLVKEYLENLPQQIRNHQHDYEIYFITITFKNSFSSLPKEVYRKFFEMFAKKINQLTINNPSKNQHKNCGLILIPEPSYSEGKMFRNPHYHGFLMINKTQSEKFYWKCITALKMKRRKRRKKSKLPPIYFGHDLSDNLLQKINRDGLKTFTTDVQRAYSIEDISKYICKKLFKTKKELVNYSFADVRKFEGFQRVYKQSEMLENCNISYEDILII